MLWCMLVDVPCPKPEVLGVAVFVCVLNVQGQRVAVKMLNMDGVRREAKLMLHQEAAIMCQLHHPSIARVFGGCALVFHATTMFKLWQYGG